MSSIFHHYAHSLGQYAFYYQDGLPRGLPSMKWVKVMLVCRRWRNIALHIPNLWRLIHVINDLDMLKLQLARSSPVTIDVFFMPPASTVAQAIPILLAEAHRIRTISHCDNSWPYQRYPEGLSTRMLECLKELFSESLPNLDTVVLFPDREDDRAAPFDLGLTAERHPGIRKLTCRFIKLPSSPAFWSSLRELHIEVRHNVQHPYLTDDILHILSSAPDLEILQLPDRCDSVRNPVPHRPIQYAFSEVVLLRRLRVVKMHGRQDPSFVQAILQHINAPALHQLRIVVSFPDEVGIGQLIQQMLLPASREIISGLDQLYLSHSGHYGVSICDSSDTFVGDNTGPLSYRFSLEIDCGQGPPGHTACKAAFDVLCNALRDAPLQSLHFVHCSHPDGIPAHMWHDLLANCTSLRTVELKHTCLRLVHSTLDALGTPAHSDGTLPLRPERLAIVRPHGLRSTLCSHDLIQHLVDVARARASANQTMQVYLEMEHRQRYPSRFRKYCSVSTCKMHRWLLLALAEQCDNRGRFWDSHHKAHLGTLFDEKEHERIDAEMKARQGRGAIATDGEAAEQKNDDVAGEEPKGTTTSTG